LPIEDNPAVPDRSLTWREVPLPHGSSSDVLAFSKDGKLIATAGEENIYITSADTGKFITRMRLPDKKHGVRMAFSEDSKTLVSGRAGSGDEIVRFWDTENGKQIRELTLRKTKEWARANGPFLDISPDAKRIAAAGYGAPYGRLELLDAKDGSLLHQDDTKLCNTGRFGHDGQLITMASGAHFGVWNTRTGANLLNVEAWNLRYGKNLIFPDIKENVGYGMRTGGSTSQDNRLLVADGYPSHGGLPFMHVWRLGINAKAPSARVPGLGEGWPIAGVLSPNGRTMAVCSPPEFGIYDMIRGEYRPEFKAPAMKCSHVMLAPDGVTLAVIAESTAIRTDNGTLSVYLTRFPKLARAVPEKGDWTAADAALLWDGVSSRNEFRRAFCVRTLNSRADQAIAIAREQLRPMPQAELERTKAMIQKLEDNDPDVRDKMTLHLHGSVFTFEPLFRTLLKESKPGELRNRLTIILDQVDQIAVPPYLEPQIRQIMFLEQLGSPDARKLLAEIAAGAPGARITEEASETLKRLPQK